MENRRLFTFLMTSLLFMILWGQYLQPKFFPEKKKPKAPDQQVVDAAKSEPQQSIAAKANDAADPNVPADPNEPSTPAADVIIPSYPSQELTLGSLDPQSGYALAVDLTSAGAAIESVWLTSPQFRDLQDEKLQARIVGNTPTPDRTFSTAFAVIDQQLAKTGQTLETANWKLASTEQNEGGSTATFEYEAPDKSLRIRKTYTLPKLKLIGKELQKAWRDDAAFYTLQVAIEMTNLTDKQKSLEYEMQGPVGVLLENQEHTSKYRDIHIEFIDGTKGETTAAATVRNYVDEIEETKGQSLSQKEQFDFLREDKEWTSAFRYAGVDVQFFAALISAAR